MHMVVSILIRVKRRPAELGERARSTRNVYIRSTLSPHLKLMCRPYIIFNDF